MNQKKLAALYLRFWTDDHFLTDNAPEELRTFVGSVATNDLRRHALVYEAVKLLATGDPAEVPDLKWLLQWFAKVPSAIAQCDAILSGRQPPKSLQTVLRLAYLAELSAVKSQVQTFLAAEIAKFE